MVRPSLGLFVSAHTWRKSFNHSESYKCLPLPSSQNAKRKVLLSVNAKARQKNLEDLDHDVPVLELQDLAESGDGGPESGQDIQDAKGDTGGKGKGRETVIVQKEGEKTGLVVATKKRKREAAQESQGVGGVEGEGAQPGKGTAKRRKGDVGDLVEEDEGAGQGRTKSEKSKQRFILFLGNLKYTTTVEAIQVHFAACEPPPTIRLLAPKPAGNKLSSKPVVKSKGCAFLEFKHQGALQQGLKLHHSSLDGRRINVELTAGGGGKSETRLLKLKERNKELEDQRRKRLQKKAASQGEESMHKTEGTKRFSTTSGTIQEVQKMRTWTVGDTEESITRRGGKKHAKSSKARRPNVKDWSTGVNAIPVG